MLYFVTSGVADDGADSALCFISHFKSGFSVGQCAYIRSVVLVMLVAKVSL